jgi:hypothetical protein
MKGTPLNVAATSPHTTGARLSTATMILDRAAPRLEILPSLFEFRRAVDRRFSA